ncbi:DUF669 domain-containing protein [Furfurilactobacillus entadae]|uniref:DUF669 domain-containing protein n=1 Tax=Furfurilactobacillus entadae TaxID=2922307 RepID=UPI0035EF22F0
MKIDRHNVAGGNYLNEAGTFEAFIYSFSTGVTKKGNNSLSIGYRVRTDVDQDHKGERVDYADNYNDSEIGERYINSLIVNAGVEEDKLPDDSNVNLTKIGMALLGKPVRITNERVASYSDPSKKVNNITSVESTQFPKVAASERKGRIAGDVTNKNGNSKSTHSVPADPFTGNSDSIDISDDDLPF